jgi:hypothetical protein
LPRTFYTPIRTRRARSRARTRPLVRSATATIACDCNDYPHPDCPGFDVTATFDPTRRITTFYDAEGTRIRQQIHVVVPGTVTNAVTGKSLPTTGVRNITVDLVTGEFKSTATNTHVIVPGQGTVQLAAGLLQIVADGNLVKEVGRQDPPVTSALCAALA